MPPPARPSDAKKSAAAATTAPTKSKFRGPLIMVLVVAALAVFLPSVAPPAHVLMCSFQQLAGSDGSAEWHQQFETLDKSPDAFGTYNETTYWGTYRPQIMMGVKSKNYNKNSVLFGLGWRNKNTNSIRHETGEDFTFQWVVHDGRHFGIQQILDEKFGLRVEIQFLKAPNAQGWNVKVRGRQFPSPHRNPRDQLEMFFYFAKERATLNDIEVLTGGYDAEDVAQFAAAAGSSAVLKNEASSVTYQDVFLFSSAELHGGEEGEMLAKVTDTCNTASDWEIFGWNGKKKPAHLPDPWQVPLDTLKHARILSHGARSNSKKTKPNEPPKSKSVPSKFNTVVMRKAVGDEIEMDVSFVTRKAASGAADFPTLLPSCAMTSLVAQRRSKFHAKFNQLFGLDKVVLPNSRTVQVKNRDGSTTSHQQSVSKNTLIQMAEMGLSNMIGGLGYWKGKYKVVDAQLDALEDQGHQIDPFTAMRNSKETAHEIALFSGVPSRAKFPRGFLWDEGFHQLLMAKWDPELSKDVISHWLLNAKDSKSGWIPREQVLGAEPRSRIPPEFVAQHPSHANPPSMFLQMQDFAFEAAEALKEEGEGRKTDPHHDFLHAMLPHLKQWREWFHRTQCGGPTNCTAIRGGAKGVAGDDAKHDQFAYRWRSRNGYHLLASGLDDYARPVSKNAHTKELHLDLFCWVGMMTQTLQSIENSMKIEDSSESTATKKSLEDEEKASMQLWEQELIKHHWDEQRQRFSDVTGRRGKDKRFSEYFGYVNLFPVLTMILNDREKALGVIREARKDLMTGYGLASLGASGRQLLHSPQGRKDISGHDNYWTGPVWLNLNFLFLRALKLKYNDMLGAEAQSLYHDLRADLIVNMGVNYERTRKIWENYHPETGKGQGTAPFTGWSALITLIMAEQY